MTSGPRPLVMWQQAEERPRGGVVTERGGEREGEGASRRREAERSRVWLLEEMTKVNVSSLVSGWLRFVRFVSRSGQLFFFFFVHT